jgi:hypothetical protein
MPLRLPHVCLTTVKVTCELSGDLHGDLEAYARLFQGERGKVIPLPTLIVTMLEDYLQHDPDFMRERRQAAAAPRARPAPASTASRPSSQDRRNGPQSQAASQGQREGDAS